jgi:hypothetical protein
LRTVDALRRDLAFGRANAGSAARSRAPQTKQPRNKVSWCTPHSAGDYESRQVANRFLQNRRIHVFPDTAPIAAD